MSEIQCSKCGKTVAAGKAFCPACGNSLFVEEKRQDSRDIDALAGTMRMDAAQKEEMLRALQQFKTPAQPAPQPPVQRSTPPNPNPVRPAPPIAEPPRPVQQYETVPRLPEKSTSGNSAGLLVTLLVGIFAFMIIVAAVVAFFFLRN